MLDIYQLRTFYNLCLTKSYTATAKRINITQSAVSHSVKKLETNLNLTLVAKKGKEFSLTPEGKILFKSCEEIFTKIKDTEDKLLSEAFRESIEITIGAPVEFGTSILIDKMTPFIQKNQNFHLNFSFHHQLMDRLHKNELDLIIDCKQHFGESLESIFLCNESYSVISTPQYYKEKQLYSLKNLNNATILSCDKDGEWWERFIDSLPSDITLSLNKVTTINHIKGLINGVLNNLGITIVPRYTVADKIDNGELVELFTDTQIRPDKFKIYLKSENLKLDKFKVLIDHLKSEFAYF